MELAAGFMRLNRYVMVYAIVHNFTVQYDICDSQEPELDQFRAHPSLSCILAKVVL